MKKNRWMALLAAGILGMGMTATAGETEQVTETAQALESLVLGEKQTDLDYEVVLVNNTGKDIVQAALRVNYAEDFGDELLAEEEALEDGKQALLYITPGEMVNYVPAVYDLQLTFDDETTATLHTLPIGDADEISVLLEDEVTYIAFTSLSLGYETDTRRRESEIAEIGEKVLQADYEAKVAGGGAAGGSAGGGGVDPAQCLNNGLMF